MDKPSTPNPVDLRLLGARILGARIPEFTRCIEAFQKPEEADSELKAIYALFGTLHTAGGTSMIAKLPEAAFLRMEAEMAAFLADYLPKLEREANKTGPVHDAELLRELVIHQFELVARECMAVCASVEEFEEELRWDIARLVCCGLSQYGWLTDPMAEELDRGFTFFVMRVNPWADIPENDRASAWHVGAITGDALSHAALKLRAEALTRAAEGGFRQANQAGATKLSGDESTRREAELAVNGANGNGVDPVAARLGNPIQGIAEGSMVTDSAFWHDLEVRFRALPDTNNDLAAIRYGGKGNWQLVFGYVGLRLDGPFRSLARRAAIAAGAPSRVNALEWWLNLLKADTDSPNLKHQVVLKSAELCAEFETRAFELKATAAGGDAHIGLRRDRYPGRSWLYDHSHKPIADPKTELDYWTAHAWRGYRVWMENWERAGATVAEGHQRMNLVISGLSYDLAVLQANYVIDRGFRGEEAVRAFRDESAGLLEEVISIWRASCERLAVTFEDDTEEVKNLAQPFHRVRDDLRRLLSKLPPAEVRRESTALISSNGGATQPGILSIPGGKGRKRGPKPDYKTAARVAEIVVRLAPDGGWRLKLDDILIALDDEKIPRPKTWKRNHGYESWYASVSADDDVGRGRHLAIEAIKHHLKLAKEKPTETIP